MSVWNRISVWELSSLEKKFVFTLVIYQIILMVLFKQNSQDWFIFTGTRGLEYFIYWNTPLPAPFVRTMEIQIAIWPPKTWPTFSSSYLGQDTIGLGTLCSECGIQYDLLAESVLNLHYPWRFGESFCNLWSKAGHVWISYEIHFQYIWMKQTHKHAKFESKSKKQLE